jgi:hypothetical protein
MLPKNITDRIENEALAKFGGMSKSFMPYMQGARTEAERSRKLVEAIEAALTPYNMVNGYIMKEYADRLEQALAEYNNTEIKKV